MVRYSYILLITILCFSYNTMCSAQIKNSSCLSFILRKRKEKITVIYLSHPFGCVFTCLEDQSNTKYNYHEET